MSTTPLEPKLFQAFVKAYIQNGENASAAWRAIYPDENPVRASMKANMFIRNPDVQQSIIIAKQHAWQEVGFAAEGVMKHLVACATLDPADFFDDEGNVRPISQIPKYARLAVSGLTVEDKLDREGNPVGKKITLKFNDRLKALELIGKTEAMFTEKVQVDTTLTISQIIEDLEDRKKKTEVKSEKFNEELEEFVEGFMS